MFASFYSLHRNDLYVSVSLFRKMHDNKKNSLTFKSKVVLLDPKFCTAPKNTIACSASEG